MTTLIKNGLIYDGTGGKPVQKNILIKNGHIAKIDSVFSHKADESIDATGAIIMPGIVDVGSYADKSFSLFWDPLQESVIRQGITTQIVGNDGVSFAPFSKKSLEFTLPHSARSSMVHNGNSVKCFLKTLHGTVSTNIGTLVGARTIKTLVSEDESKELNSKEKNYFEHLTKTALFEGAFGISIGYGHTTHEHDPYYEIADFAPIAESMKRVCVIHPPANAIAKAFEEILRFSPKKGVNMEISHVLTLLDSSFTQKKITSFIETLSQKNNVHMDIVPFSRVPVHARELLPPWAFGENDRETLKTLTSPSRKGRLMRTFNAFQKFKLSVEGIADPAFQFFEGKSISSIAENRGSSYGEALLHVMNISTLRAYFLALSPNSTLHGRLLGFPRTLYTWGRARDSGKETPFSFLKSCKENDSLTLERKIEKMTSLPAKKFGIAKRGALIEGNYADVVVLKDFNLEHLFINGVHIIEEGEIRKVFPGMALTPQR